MQEKSFSLGTKSEVHSLLFRVFPIVLYMYIVPIFLIIEPASTIQTGFIAGGNTKVVLCCTYQN